MRRRAAGQARGPSLPLKVSDLLLVLLFLFVLILGLVFIFILFLFFLVLVGVFADGLGDRLAVLGDHEIDLLAVLVFDLDDIIGDLVRRLRTRVFDIGFRILVF